MPVEIAASRSVRDCEGEEKYERVEKPLPDLPTGQAGPVPASQRPRSMVGCEG
jgi:hypothetical protein